MKKSFSLTVAALLFIISYSTAQQFVIPLEGFSRKKPAYLHMENGKTLEGTLNGFKRTKGLIETVKMKDEKGKKVKVDPEKISHMYLAPSAVAKIGAALEKINNINNWEKDSNIDASLIKEGYVYFEKTSTKVKKKTNDLMMQVMNPSFSQKIVVYHDPFAKETMGIAVQGVQVAGGLDKSYYIKKEGQKTAYRLLKKNYKEEFAELFGDSPEFMKKHGDNIKWNQLETHIYDYTQMTK